MLLCQFWFWQEIGSFFVVAGKFFIMTGKKGTVVCLAGAQSLLRPEKKDTVVCLVGARSLLPPEKKDTVLCLVGARSLLRPEKKRYSRLSGGLCCCVSFWFWQEIGSFFCCGGKVLLRLEKKVTVVCLAGCAVVSVFGSGDYDRKK